MKNKVLLIILLVVVILIAYFKFCYGFANKMIDEDTHQEIRTYLKSSLNIDDDFKFIKAIRNEDYTISVFFKIDEEYYQAIIVKNIGYKVIDINRDIPSFIR